MYHEGRRVKGRQCALVTSALFYQDKNSVPTSLFQSSPVRSHQNILDHSRVSECVGFSMGTLRADPASDSSPALPHASSPDLQSQMFWGLVFLVQDPRAGEPDVGLGSLAPWGKPLGL